MLSLLLATSVHAQEQEKTLVDRLLKPDLTLTNDAQTKAFNTDRQQRTKRVTARQFATPAVAPQKQFGGERNFVTRVFSTRRFRRSARATLAGTSPSAFGGKTFATGDSAMPHDANDASKTVPTAEYSGSRPFLVRGKSQKSLSAQDTPLSIEQVRELLNRNK